MNVLETILRFLTGLARIIFPRKQNPAAGDCPCPHPYPRPLPDGDHPAVAPDGADGGDLDGHRSDTLALHQGDWGTSGQRVEPSHPRVEPIDIAGYSLMAVGSMGCLYKMLLS